MNFTFAYYGDFPINLSFIVLLSIFFLYYPKRHVHPMVLVSYVVFSATVLVSGLFASNVDEYVKSAAQLLLFLGPAMVVGASFPRYSLHYMAISINFLLALSVIAALITVTQFVFFNILDDFRFAALLGPFQARGPGGDAYIPNSLSLLKRPNSLYSEPSIAGWFLVFSASVAIWFKIIGGRVHWATAPLLILASVLTGSLSGILNAVVLGMLLLYVVKRKIGDQLIRIALMLLIMVFVAYFIMDYGIGNRLERLHVEGSSTYFRVTAPIMLIRDSLLEYPLGHPLGQVDYIASKHYMVNWAKGSSTSIDNSFFLVIYYFGWLGLAVTMAYMILVLRLIFSRRVVSIVIAMVTLALMETGALWSPRMALLIGFVIILYRYDRTLSRALVTDAGNVEKQRESLSSIAFGGKLDEKVL